MASFDAGTIQMDAGLFVNEPEFLDALAAGALARGVKLELECFTHEMIATALRYHAEGKIPAPLHFQFVTGTRHGMPATAAALVHAVDLLPERSTWSVIGVGRTQTPMAMLALAMGGHVRVGLEDAIYYHRRELATGNAQLVERAVRLAGELGRPVASPADARATLWLGREAAGLSRPLPGSSPSANDLVEDGKAPRCSCSSPDHQRRRGPQHGLPWVIEIEAALPSAAPRRTAIDRRGLFAGER